MAEAKKVTRIKATDDTPKKTPTKKTPAKKAPVKKTAVAAPVKKAPKAKKGFFAAIGGYFKGAWVELRQVRWPNRKATWALTLAVVVFSIFFLGLIMLLDLFFKYIFELIIA